MRGLKISLIAAVSAVCFAVIVPEAGAQIGVTIGVAQKLIRDGRILPNDLTVLSITGNGLKTTDAIVAEYPVTQAIAPRLDAFEAYLDRQLGTPAATAAVASRS